jgi:hypothetical protein
VFIAVRLWFHRRRVISEVFRTGPISRLRATLTILFAGAAVLSAGGMLEYASGSPAAGTTRATAFWAVFFGLNLVAFGGAALLGALPPLTRPAVKSAWAVLVAVLYAVEFHLWSRSRPGGIGAAALAWFGGSPIHLPAALAVIAGLLWGSPAAADEPTPALPHAER